MMNISSTAVMNVVCTVAALTTFDKYPQHLYTCVHEEVQDHMLHSLSLSVSTSTKSFMKLTMKKRGQLSIEMAKDELGDQVRTTQPQCSMPC